MAKLEGKAVYFNDESEGSNMWKLHGLLTGISDNFSEEVSVSSDDSTTRIYFDIEDVDVEAFEARIKQAADEYGDLLESMEFNASYAELEDEFVYFFDKRSGSVEIQSNSGNDRFSLQL